MQSLAVCPQGLKCMCVYVFVCSYGYIEFDDAKVAASAQKNMQGTTIDGREIFVDFASEMQTPPATFNGKRKSLPGVRLSLPIALIFNC